MLGVAPKRRHPTCFGDLRLGSFCRQPPIEVAFLWASLKATDKGYLPTKQIPFSLSSPVGYDARFVLKRRTSRQMGRICRSGCFGCDPRPCPKRGIETKVRANILVFLFLGHTSEENIIADRSVRAFLNFF